jgi:hypothetical protein
LLYILQKRIKDKKEAIHLNHLKIIYYFTTTIIIIISLTIMSFVLLCIKRLQAQIGTWAQSKGKAYTHGREFKRKL